jgi:hypothetical protein
MVVSSKLIQEQTSNKLLKVIARLEHCAPA